MIKFNNKIRVRCLECRNEHYIDMINIGTEKEQRSFGFEYEHIFRGKLRCDCGENMKILTNIYEYPKDIINYIDTSEKSCLIMDKISKKDIIFVDDKKDNKKDMKRYKSKLKIYAEQYFDGIEIDGIEISIGKSSTTDRFDDTPDGTYIQCVDSKRKLKDGDWICISDELVIASYEYKKGIYISILDDVEFNRRYKLKI